MITVGVIVSEANLASFCSDILSRCSGPDLRIWSTPPQGEFLVADVLFYAVGSEPIRYDALEATGARTWLLAVDPDRIAEIRPSLPADHDIQFIAAPIHPPMLQIRLEHLLAAYRNDRSIVTHPIAALQARRECDQLLQLLLVSQQRLQESTETRNNILARAGHDLAGSVSALNGYCGLLKSQLAPVMTSSQVQILQYMQRNIFRIAKLAESLTELCVNTPASDLPLNEFPGLHLCVHQAVQEVASHFEDKEITLKVDLHEVKATVHLEPVQMQYALSILLENSCRSSVRRRAMELVGHAAFWESRSTLASRPRMCMPTSSDANAYVLELREATGREMEEEWNAGSDGDGAVSLTHTHTDRGLGSVVCQMIVEQHGGRLYEMPSNNGTEFSVVLPVKRSVRGDAARMQSVG